MHERHSVGNTSVVDPGLFSGSAFDFRFLMKSGPSKFLKHFNPRLWQFLAVLGPKPIAGSKSRSFLKTGSTRIWIRKHLNLKMKISKKQNENLHEKKSTKMYCNYCPYFPCLQTPPPPHVCLQKHWHHEHFGAFLRSALSPCKIEHSKEHWRGKRGEARAAQINKVRGNCLRKWIKTFVINQQQTLDTFLQSSFSDG